MDKFNNQCSRFARGHGIPKDQFLEYIKKSSASEKVAKDFSITVEQAQEQWPGFIFNYALDYYLSNQPI